MKAPKMLGQGGFILPGAEARYRNSLGVMAMVLSI